VHDPPTCVPSSHGSGLHYDPPSPCVLGTEVCRGALGWQCEGGVGPETEVCDGIDNDCNGVVDDGQLIGTGAPCGSIFPPCTGGIVDCVDGVLTCVTSGVQPVDEVCNGIDDDCDGFTDEPPLADGPAPGQTGCWNRSGTCCIHGSLQWCPPLDPLGNPSGAICYDVGTLTPPCNKGTLTCDHENGWICVGPVNPLPEVCDGVDNDCDGQTDEGVLSDPPPACNEGLPLPCTPGVLSCVDGSLECINGVLPGLEICDGVDNDCDGDVDEEQPPNGSCVVPPDAAYPGDRDHPPCQQGQL
jgi:hypothetical protein